MQKKTIMQLSLIAVIVLACTRVLRPANSGSGNSTSKEAMVDCRKNTKSGNANTNIIWESLSRQFFTTSELLY
jgi:hypothetical protein